MQYNDLLGACHANSEASLIHVIEITWLDAIGIYNGLSALEPL